MFDVGFTELMLLAIIGLLVLGPERLPKLARTLGGLTRKARSSWLNLKRSIDAEINAEEFKKPIQKMQDDVRAAVKDVDEKLKDEKFKKPIQKMQDDIRSAVKDVDEKLKDVSKAPTAKKPDHDTN